MFFSFSLIMEEPQTTLPKCVCCRLLPQILFKVTGPKIKDNKYLIDFIEEICCIKDNGWCMHLLETNEGICRHIFASQGLRFGSPFSPPLADLEYILRIHALIFHWLQLPVHVSNQKTFYTEHMLSTKCKQRWHRNALI